MTKYGIPYTGDDLTMEYSYNLGEVDELYPDIKHWEGAPPKDIRYYWPSEIPPE